MNNLDAMLKRNREYAAQRSEPGAQMAQSLPNVKAVIIGCADMRVDPAHVLGIKPGEAVVMRNIGGRITPGLLEQLSMLGRIGEVAGALPGGGGEFHLIVLQHTDCGITRLAKDTSMLAHYFQIQERGVEARSIQDPRAAVAIDVAALRAVPALPGEWLISGLVYDVSDRTCRRRHTASADWGGSTRIDRHSVVVQPSQRDGSATTRPCGLLNQNIRGPGRSPLHYGHGLCASQMLANDMLYA